MYFNKKHSDKETKGTKGKGIKTNKSRSKLLHKMIPTSHERRGSGVDEQGEKMIVTMTTEVLGLTITQI